MVDALALGASGATRESSSLSFRTSGLERDGRFNDGKRQDASIGDDDSWVSSDGSRWPCPASAWPGEVDQRLKRLARTARMKGFRPGQGAVCGRRQQFGSQVHAEAVSDLMQSTFAEAVSQQQLRPAGGPRIEPIAIEPGSELRYAAIFEVLPEVTLKPLDAIAVERPDRHGHR